MKKAFGAVLVMSAVLLSEQAWAQTTYEAGQAVEVREGDTWSKATLVRKEGRKYLIRYDGATDEEWVTADRLRGKNGSPAAGNAQSAPAATGTGDAATGAGEASKEITWKLGQSIEVKRGRDWRTATVMKLENGWVLALYTPGGFKEWVEPWRIRAQGTKQDTIGNAPMHAEVKGDEAAPKDPPTGGTGASGLAAAPANWREAVVGDRVIYEYGDSPKYGKYLQKKDGKALVLEERSNNQRWVDERDVRVAGLRLEVKVGDRVMVHDGHWVYATVMAREGERARVKIDGWDAEMFHKWRMLDELRPPSASDVPPIENASPADLRKIPGYKEAIIASGASLSLIVSSTAKLQPDACAQANTQPVRFASVRGSSGEAFPRVIVAPHAGSTIAAVACQAHGKDSIMVDRVDLATGATLSSMEVPLTKEMRFCDISPDGTRAIIRKDGAFGQGDRVEVWAVDGESPRREMLFFPYFQGNPHNKDARFALFVRDDRMLTVGGDDMQLWDIKTGRAVYSTTIASSAEPALSAGGKYIAFTTGKEAMVIDAATGTAVLELPQLLAGATRFAFSPSGKQLLACNAQTIWAVDLEKNELYRDFSVPGNLSMQQIASPGDGFAMVNNSVLLDLEQRTMVWRYELPGNSAAAVLPSGVFAYALDTDSRAACSLIAATIPHPAALKAIRSAPPTQLLLKPGDKISLAMGVPCSEQERQQIMRHIESELASRQITIVPGQPMQLILSLEMGKSETREYSSGPRFGPFAQPGETVTFTPKISRMRLEYQGRKVWEVSAVSGVPGVFLMRKANQTMQQAVDEQSGPNLGLFSSAHLPGYLAQPRNPIYLGISELSLRGMRDKKADPEPDVPITPAVPPKNTTPITPTNAPTV